MGADCQKVKEIAPDYGFTGKLRASFRLAIILPWIFINIPLQIVFIALKSKLRYSFPVFFHRVLVKGILGMRIEIAGTPSKTKPTFFLSNHLSYADIPVVSTVLPMSFVSRADVASWPLLGVLAVLQDTVFVERKARKDRHAQNRSILDFLRAGKNLMIFPEGTSTDGKQVLPFKSALMQDVAEHGRDICIQPVSIAILNRDGAEHYYPWYGDMDFPEHVWPFLQVPRLSMRITFHPTFTASRFEDRKALADEAHNSVVKAAYGVNS